MHTGVCNISSARVCVPKTTFIDEEVCREEASVNTWLCVGKGRDGGIQADVRAAHCIYTQAMTVHQKSKEKKSAPTFTLHILQIVGLLK